VYYDHSLVVLCKYTTLSPVIDSLRAGTLQPSAAVNQERGHAGATMQELILDGISMNCESCRRYCCPCSTSSFCLYT